MTQATGQTTVYIDADGFVYSGDGTKLCRVSQHGIHLYDRRTKKEILIVPEDIPSLWRMAEEKLIGGQPTLS